MLMLSYYRTLKENLSIGHDVFWTVFIYGATIALLSLVVPISVQSLINVVSFGTLLQPIFLLTLIVFVILSIVAIMRIYQAIVVETIQQTIFTNIGIKLAKVLPRLDFNNYDQCSMQEYTNIFFEVQTIQKTFAVMIITGIDIILLAIFSLILIAFYHPYLLAFNIVLIIFLLLSLLLPVKGALKYALIECHAKHKFGSWLEEIVTNIITFKLQGYSDYALLKTDDKIVDYLKARKNHFSFLLMHIASMNAIFVIANTVLLGLGGYLVIKEQLSLGQLIASELIINALLYGFVRFSYYLEDLYDLLASNNKLSTLIGLKAEPDSQEFRSHDPNSHQKILPAIELKNIYYYGENRVIKNYSIKINSGDHVIISEDEALKNQTIIDLILGFRRADEGILKFNNILIQDYNLRSLRQDSTLVRKIELLSGSLLENIILNNETINIEDIHKLLEQLNVNSMIERAPEGLDTYISISQLKYSDNDLYKLMLVRALIHKPSLLIIDGVLDKIEWQDAKATVNYLKKYSGTLIITTRNQNLIQYFYQGL